MITLSQDTMVNLIRRADFFLNASMLAANMNGEGWNVVTAIKNKEKVYCVGFSNNTGEVTVVELSGPFFISPNDVFFKNKADAEKLLAKYKRIFSLVPGIVVKRDKLDKEKVLKAIKVLEKTGNGFTITDLSDRVLSRDHTSEEYEELYEMVVNDILYERRLQVYPDVVNGSPALCFTKAKKQESK
jgi:hypothetical protein